MSKIRIVLIDVDESFLKSLNSLLLNFKDLEVIGAFEDANEGLDFILKNEPDLAFVQIEMPNLSGLEIAEEISKLETDVKIILVSVLIFVAMVSVPLLIKSGNVHFKHLLEWNYFIGVIFFYLLTYFFWKKN